MSIEDRRATEDLYIKKVLRIVFATSVSLWLHFCISMALTESFRHLQLASTSVGADPLIIMRYVLTDPLITISQPPTLLS